jgi:hypothetical protein
MPVQDLALYGIGAVLFLVAVAVSFLIFSEVIQLVRDIIRNRNRTTDDYPQGSAPPRRITPFRDRGTVERLISYFTRQDRR